MSVPRRPLALLVVLGALLGLLPATAGAVPPSGIPTRTSPVDGTDVGANPTLSWLPLDGAVRYRVQLDDSPSFTPPLLFEVDTVNTAATPPVDLPLGTLHWRVAGTDASGGVGGFSAGSFSKSWEVAPAVLAPADDAVLAFPQESSTFAWEPLAGAKSYGVQWDDEPNFVDPEVAGTPATSYTVPEPQTNGQTFYWRVQGQSGTSGVVSAWSPVRRYQVSWSVRSGEEVLPARPTPVAPPNTTLLPVEDVALEWTPVAGAALYHVQISPNGDWANNLIVDQDVLSTRYQPALSLQSSSYFWRVQAQDVGGNEGTWSEEWTFRRAWAEFPPEGGSRDERPVLRTPASGATVQVPSLSWDPIDHAAYYEVDLSSDPNFSPGRFTSCRTNQTHVTYHQLGAGRTPPQPGTCTDGLVIGQTTYWRVRGVDAPGSHQAPTVPIVSVYSTVSSFVWRPAEPSVLGPEPGTSTSAPVLSWTPTGGAHQFEVTLTRATGQTTTHPTFATSYTPERDLAPADSPVRWSVRTVDLAGRDGVLVSGGSFSTVEPTASATPLRPLTPTNGTAGRTPPSFTWGSAGPDVTYQVLMRSGPTREQAANALFTQRSPVSPRLPFAAWTPTDNLAPGFYDWFVRAVSPTGVLLGSGDIASFVIEGLQPAVATSPPNCLPTAPCDAIAGTPTLRWNPVPDAGYYIVSLAIDAAFTTVVREYTTSLPQLTPRESLLDSQAGQAYYWFVRPCRGSGAGLACGSADLDAYQQHARAFRKVSAPVQLVDPLPDQAVLDRFTARWQDYLSARQYRVQISGVADFATTYQDVVVDGTSYTALTSTYPEGPLYWRVQAIDGSGNPLTYSPARRATLSSSRIGLVGPVDGARPVSQPSLSWHPLPYAARYQVEVYRNGDTAFSPANRVVNATTLHTSFTSATALPAGTYAWRVRRLDAQDRVGPWSGEAGRGDRRTFVVATAGPEQVAPADGAVATDNRLRFAWRAVAGATSYELQVSTSPSFASTVDRQVTVATSWAPTIAYPDTTLHWRVRALDATGAPTATSAVRVLRHDATRPSVATRTPATAIPPDGTISVTFSEPVLHASPATFDVRILDAETPISGAVTPDQEAATSSATFTPSQPLQPGTPYEVTLSDGITDVLGNPLLPVTYVLTTTGRAPATPTPSPTGTASPAATPTATPSASPRPSTSPTASPSPTAAPGPVLGRRIGDATDVVAAAVGISRATFADGEAALVLLGRADVFADSLAGAALAGTQGPILYTPGGPDAALAPAARDELVRVLGAPRVCGDGEPQVGLLGGEQAVSAAVQREVEGLRYCVERFAGASRAETSVEVARAVVARGGSGQVLVARGETWADAATGGAYAAAAGAPIVVTFSDQLHPAVDAFLAQRAPAEIVLLGGTVALSPAVEAAAAARAPVRRVAGAARDETAIAIAQQLWGSRGPTGVALVNGFVDSGWAYALAGAVPAARAGAVEVYVGDTFSPSTTAFLDAFTYRDVFAVGPAVHVPQALVDQAVAGVG